MQVRVDQWTRFGEREKIATCVLRRGGLLSRLENYIDLEFFETEASAAALEIERLAFIPWNTL